VLSPTRNEILTLFISANEVDARLEGGEVFKMHVDARLWKRRRSNQTDCFCRCTPSQRRMDSGTWRAQAPLRLCFQMCFSFF